MAYDQFSIADLLSPMETMRGQDAARGSQGMLGGWGSPQTSSVQPMVGTGVRLAQPTMPMPTLQQGAQSNVPAWMRNLFQMAKDQADQQQNPRARPGGTDLKTVMGLLGGLFGGAGAGAMGGSAAMGGAGAAGAGAMGGGAAMVPFIL